MYRRIKSTKIHTVTHVYHFIPTLKKRQDKNNRVFSLVVLHVDLGQSVYDLGQRQDGAVPEVDVNAARVLQQLRQDRLRHVVC